MKETGLPADWFNEGRLKLRHLGVLLAIDRHRHIGRAARELHISQPALSKTLQELERAAGIALLVLGVGGRVRVRPTVYVVGEVAPGRAVTRAGARPGARAP